MYKKYESIIASKNELFEGERHAPLILPDGSVEFGNWIGPGTQVIKRLRRGDKPKTATDRIAMRHDLDYTIARNVDDIRRADQRMIESLNRLQAENGDHPLNIFAGKKAIESKVYLEDKGLLSKEAYAGGFQNLSYEEKYLVQSKINELEQMDLLNRFKALNRQLGVPEFPTAKELLIGSIRSSFPVNVQEYLNILQELMQQKTSSEMGTTASSSPVIVVETDVEELKKNIGEHLLQLEKLKEFPVPDEWVDYPKLSKVLKRYMSETLPQIYNDKVNEFERLKSSDDSVALQNLLSKLINEVEYLFSLVNTAFYMFHTRSEKEMGLTQSQIHILFDCVEHMLQEDDSEVEPILYKMVSLGLVRGLCSELRRGWWSNYKFRALLTRLLDSTTNKKHKAFFQELLDEMSGLCEQQMVFTDETCPQALEVATTIMNNVARLWKLLLTAKLPGKEERPLIIPIKAEDLLLILADSEQKYLKKKRYTPSESFLSKAKEYVSIYIIILLAKMIAKNVDAAIDAASTNPQFTNVQFPLTNVTNPVTKTTYQVVRNPFNITNLPPVSDTCSNFYNANINTALLEKHAFVITGEEKSGLSTVLRCVQPNVFAVDISPVINKLNNITSEQDFYKFEVSQVARQIVNNPVTTFGDVTEKEDDSGFQLVESLCRYFPDDATKEELSKLASYVKLVVDALCSRGYFCKISSNFILKDTKSLGREGALEILERARVVSNFSVNSTEDAFNSLSTLATHIKNNYGKELAIRLDASDITDNSFNYQKLADFALSHDMQSAARTRTLTYQYAFPSDKGIRFPMEHGKLPPVQEIQWTEPHLQELLEQHYKK
jgi:hypothetical protein